MFHHVYRFRRENPYSDNNLRVLLIGDVVCAGDYYLDAHTHEQIEFCLITKGSGEFCLDNRALKVSAGDIFMSLPGQVHYAGSDPADPYRFFYMMFEVNPQGALAGIYYELLKCRENKSCDRYDMGWLFNMAIHEIIGSLPASEAMLGSLLNGITVLLHRNFCVDYKSFQTKINSKYELVQKTISYIDANIHKKMDLHTISHEIGSSYSYLSRIFKEQFGISITDYCKNVKMDRAKMLLSGCNALSVTEAAAQVGYEDIHYFSRLFKSRFGYSPSRLRRDRMQTTLRPEPRQGI